MSILGDQGSLDVRFETFRSVRVIHPKREL